QPAAIRITPDGVPRDDALHFVLERAPSIPVLLVEGGTAGADPDIYLQRALEIGDKPSFDVTMRRFSQLAAADLAGKRLVILDNTPWPAGDLGRRLEAFVRGGGGWVMVVAGDAVSASTWQGRGNGVLPVVPGDVKDRVSDKGAVLGYIDR